ncbi:hypothetical protein C8R43DRAFT_944949 [Mycena crocata]|nr:hypothetical protein C8R43DRAFT_944949 [Mycena crocata]
MCGMTQQWQIEQCVQQFDTQHKLSLDNIRTLAMPNVWHCPHVLTWANMIAVDVRSDMTTQSLYTQANLPWGLARTSLRHIAMSMAQLSVSSVAHEVDREGSGGPVQSSLDCAGSGGGGVAKLGRMGVLEDLDKLYSENNAHSIEVRHLGPAIDMRECVGLLYLPLCGIMIIHHDGLVTPEVTMHNENLMVSPWHTGIHQPVDAVTVLK